MAEFKVGDEVIVRNCFGASLHRVARATKRFIELDNRTRWNHRGGPYPKGRDLSGGRLEPIGDSNRDLAMRLTATDKFAREVRRLARRINVFPVYDVLAGNLEDIEAATAALAKLEVKA